MLRNECCNLTAEQKTFLQCVLFSSCLALFAARSASLLLRSCFPFAMVLTRLFPTQKEKKQTTVQKKSMKDMKETQEEEKSVASYARPAVQICRSMHKSRLSDAAREQVRGLKFQVENNG